MTTPEVLETLVNVNGAEFEARYTIDAYGVHLLQVQIGDSWQDPTWFFLPHVVGRVEAQISELERELAEVE